MRILLDMDDTICQWSDAVRDTWNKSHPDKQIAQISTWDLVDLIPHAEARYFTQALMRKVSFWENLRPVPGAILGVETLLKQGHEIRIVTQILPYVGGPAYEGKLNWLTEHMPFVSLDWVHVTKNKCEIDGDLLLDDSPHQLADFNKKAWGFTVAMDRPWNRHVAADHRVTTWGEFLKLVKELADE
jgi:5'(3')-deoxyribonucleotidase